MRKYIIASLLIFCSVSSIHSQILISLIFGDKLNSEKLEFGLDGGLALCDIANLQESDVRPAFNLGFYFDFRLNQSSTLFIHTGVIVKSPAGTQGLTPYPTGNQELDILMTEGEVQRRFNCFYVPGLLRYRFPFSGFVEAGPQAGLLSKAQDHFITKLKSKKDLVYKEKIIDDYNRIDFGFTVGLGYKFLNGEGMAIGARYYWGLVDILKDSAVPAQYNRIGYLFVGIPIGAKK